MPAGARRILSGWWWSGWLWCCRRSCWWCSQYMTKRSSPAGSSRGGGGPVREGYKVVALLLKPSLGLFGLVGRRQVLLPHPGSATSHLIALGDHHTLQHIQVHFGIDFQADYKDVRWHDVTLTWNHTKDHNCSRKLCFHQPGHIPVIRGNSDLHFEGAGNGPVVITWIVRESMSCTVAHCWSRSLNIVSLSDMIEGSYCSWDLYATGQLVYGLQQKKENWFSLNGNGIYIVFSRVTILSFHPVLTYKLFWILSGVSHYLFLTSIFLILIPTAFYPIRIDWLIDWF